QRRLWYDTTGINLTEAPAIWANSSPHSRASAPRRVAWGLHTGHTVVWERRYGQHHRVCNAARRPAPPCVQRCLPAYAIGRGFVRASAAAACTVGRGIAREMAPP